MEGDQFPSEETVPVALYMQHTLHELHCDQIPFCAVSSTFFRTLPLPYLLHCQCTDRNSAVGKTWQYTRLVAFLVAISASQRRPSGLHCVSRRPKRTVADPRGKEGFIFHTFFFAVALRPNAGHGLLILDVSRSHTTTQHSR